MGRNNYSKYFHEDFFESSYNFQTKTSNLELPGISTVDYPKSRQRGSIDLNIYEEVKPNSSYNQDKKEELLYNKAPNIFEVNYHIQKLFWSSLILLTLIPILWSGLACFVSLNQNILKNIELKKIKQKLVKDHQDINEKIRNYRSYSGMKRTIKEEIKALEENEILIKIVK
jgi:hypothetical protein